MTLIEMLEENVRVCPDKIAIICEEKTLTHAELYNMSLALGNHFVMSGIVKGDKIVIMMDSKQPELVVAFLAIAACGGIAVPVDCNRTDAHIRQLFEIFPPAAVVISERVYHKLEIYNFNLPAHGIIVCHSEQEKKQYTLLADILNSDTALNSLPNVPIDNNDDNDIVYFNLTSGTTGFPKCAVTTHANIYWNTRSAIEQLALNSEDIHLCMFPPSTHPHEIFARGIFLGGTIVLTDHIAPKSLTKIIEDNRVTAMMAIAPIYGNFTRCHKNNTFNFTSLRIAESGGMHVDPVTKKAFKKRFGIPIVPVWGSTETAGIALGMPMNAPEKNGSCGIPSNYYEIKIIDEDGNETLPGEVGEMIVKGPGVCSSYYQNESETRQNFRDGWYYTTDIFKKDDDGYFYFSGRKNGMMKVGGMKVFPIEIEDLLIQHPFIKEVAVTKNNDPTHGEIPRAVIVLEEGALLTKKEIRAYCTSKIAAYKIPKVIEFRQALPRNPVGKILINAL